MAHKVLDNGTAYEISGGKVLDNGTAYDIYQGRVMDGGTVYDIAFSSVSPILNDNDWATIRAVSDAGDGENYWSVGDCKEIVLNGKVGNLSLSNFTTYAFIIGFNHNSIVEGNNRIHFQLAKTALSGGKDVALCDSKFNSTVYIDGYFSMNSSKTNSGGWASSQMRTNICGTSLTNYSGSIISAIPDELRSVLKPVTKYTDNTAYNGGSNASYVTATTDYFFLLSEFEIFGKNSYGNTYEANKQEQYAYYSAGNSKKRYKHSEVDIACWWYLRSPGRTSANNFILVTSSGENGGLQANNSEGFSPGFCV